ncbi:MAG: ABC transporter ATP-binding protein [Kofleriaceae bacterium]|nr:ABC transporter ATP-binding protein [Kofleriaceae bacterium]
MTHDPKGPPGGTGSGPAGGGSVQPTPVTRDPAAEAAALAAFEADEKQLAVKDEPAGVAEANMAKAEARSPSPAATPAPAKVVTGGEQPRMAELGKPLAKPPVVQFDKVTKTYGTGESAFTAIKDVTFSIPDYPGRGEFVSILGPSGCGKSTVIRMIAGLLPQFPQTSGRVLVDGKVVTGPGPDRGMVFQDYTSFDNRSVRDNVAFGLECRGLSRMLESATRKQTVAQFSTVTPHGFDKGMTVTIEGVADASFNGKAVVLATPSPTVFTVQHAGKPDAKSHGGSAVVPKLSKAERNERANYWIEKVGLSVKKDADKYPHQLSGGMRQRVAIARTLILEPRIILMDEPFGALDPPTRSRMQDNLVALWREQSPTIFFITHSIEEAVFLGDHILMFSNSPGTVLQEIRVPPPDRPSIVMQRDAKFIETVMGIRETIDRLESSNRAGD